MKQIKIGALLSYVSILLTFIVGLLYTPFLVRYLGQSDYGIYSLVISMVAYMSLLDMGISNAIIRYISRNKEIGTKREESDLLGQFLVFFSIVGLLVLSIGIILNLNAYLIFENSLNYEQIDILKTMILILSINLALSFPLNVFSAFLQAYEQFIFLKSLNVLRTILIPIISLYGLYLGGHLIMLSIITTVVNLAILSLTLLYCKKKYNVKVTFGPLKNDMKKEIMFYSFFIFITAVADKIYWQTDQVMLGIMDSPESVAIYAIAIQLVMIFGTLSTSISNLFLPSVSKLVTKKEHMEELNIIYIGVSRVQCYILGLAFSGFIIFGEEFIIKWTGTDFLLAYWLVIILMIPFFFDLVSNIGLSILQAKGLNVFRAVSLLICSILNILISIPILDKYGSLGTAIVSSIFIGIGNVILLNLYYKFKVKLDVRKYWISISSILIPIILLSTVYYLFVHKVIKHEYFIINIIAYICIYIFMIYYFVMNEFEKNNIKKLFIKFKPK